MEEKNMTPADHVDLRNELVKLINKYGPSNVDNAICDLLHEDD